MAGEKKKALQKRSIETREKIINTAERLFAEHGFNETNTNLIAKEADISVGSIYTHFADKWEIFLIILERHSEKVYNFAQQGIEKIMKDQQHIKDAVKWMVPELYEVNKLNGKLNFELEKFVMIDPRAARIDEKWENLEDELIYGFLKKHKDYVKIKDYRAAARIINLQLRVVFNYLFNNRGRVDEKAVLNTFVSMIINSLES